MGLSELAAVSVYVVPGASAASAICTLRPPSPTTSGVPATGPPGPISVNPLGPVTGSENVTTSRVPRGTSTWWSIGYVNTTPAGAVASGGITSLPHPHASTVASTPTILANTIIESIDRQVGPSSEIVQ